MQNTWVSRIGIVALFGGLWLVNHGLEITPATAASPVNEDPHAGLTQNWDKVLPAAERFVILTAFTSDAVLDKSTGLVWETSPQLAAAKWSVARFTCINKTVGGQKGWRLPSIPELTSLIDPSVAPPGPTLPSGHPLQNVQSANYWSATTIAESPAVAWNVFSNGGAVLNTKKDLNSQVWCVRGPMNAATY
jgi:hypothetical protein